jgi:hypothetical protein
MTTRAEYARSLVENPEFAGLIEELRDHQFAVIEHSPPENVKQREGAYAFLRALGELYHALETYASTGAHQKGREATRRMMGGGNGDEHKTG